MKKQKIKETSAERAGREFLEAFKKLPYSTDRIGQSFVAPISTKKTEITKLEQ